MSNWYEDNNGWAPWELRDIKDDIKQSLQKQKDLKKNIFKEIMDEMQRQLDKWGCQDHSPNYWMVILMEEIGEACHEICGSHKDLPEYRKELIHVAAVCFSAMESYDRDIS